MKPRKHSRIILIFSAIGALFSGYLTYSKMVLHTCAVDPGCPYFLGKPACIYGFGLFFMLLIFAILYNRKKASDASKKVLFGITFFAALGTLFAGYMSYIDFRYPPCPPGECEYLLLLPSCVYGTLFFAVILILSIRDIYRFKQTDIQ